MRPAGWRRLFRLREAEDRVQRAVDDELAFHVEMRTQKLMTAGLSAAVARAQALQQFGDLEAMRLECMDINERSDRSMRRVQALQEFRQDVVYALRGLRHSKALMTVVVASLVLGIGANTAVFTLVDALLLRALPVSQPGQLVVVGDATQVNTISMGSPARDLYSNPVYEAVRDNTRHLVTGLFATGDPGRLDVLLSQAGGSAGGEPDHPSGRLVSGNYFAVLGVPALQGRTFSEAEDRVPGGAPVVVISHAWWQHRLGGARDAVGRKLTINGSPFTIIGVARRGFSGDIVGQPTDLWVPLTMQPVLRPHRPWLQNANVNWLLFMGRLAPGVTLERARTGLAAVVDRAVDAQTPGAAGGGPGSPPRDPIPVTSGSRGFSSLRPVYQESLLTLQAAVALVLLVVCANVANLLFARGAARQREIGLRVALGAGRARLVRQLLTESALLALWGGLLGLIFAWWASRALLTLAGGGGALALETRPEARVLGYTALLSLLTAVLCGLAPSLRASRIDIGSLLRSHSRGALSHADDRPGRRWGAGRLLVVAQVALSLTLLVGTAMLVRTTRNLDHANAGLARDELVVVTLDATPTGYTGAQLAALSRSILARARQLPGVAAATFSQDGIFSGMDVLTTLQVEGFTARQNEDTLVHMDLVAPDYFSVLGAHLVRGRDVQASDDEHAARVAVINETMAKFYFPDGSALGRHLTMGDAAYEVVGIVADITDHGLRNAPVRRMYLPYFQAPSGPPPSLTLELRSRQPVRLVKPVRDLLVTLHPDLTVLSASVLSQLMRQSVGQSRLVARVVSLFGCLALLLAALGLYGLITYATIRRTSEFGLRMALGAPRRSVLRMVLSEAMGLVLAGGIAGVPLALTATRLMRNQLFGVSVIDPPSIALALAVLSAAAALAAYLPARRAARVAPLLALRSE